MTKKMTVADVTRRFVDVMELSMTKHVILDPNSRATNGERARDVLERILADMNSLSHLVMDTQDYADALNAERHNRNG